MRALIAMAALAGNYYLTTLTIWFGHWASHLPNSPTYEFHVGGHHALYPNAKASVSRTFLYGSGRTSSIFALLPPLVVQAALLAALARGWLRAELLLETVTLVATFNWVHTQFHTGRTRLRRFRWFQRARRIHFSHHDSEVNYMVGDHLWDRIFQTYRPATPDASSMKGES